MRPISVKYPDTHNRVGAVPFSGTQAAEVFYALCDRMAAGYAGESPGPFSGEAAEDSAQAQLGCDHYPGSGRSGGTLVSAGWQAFHSGKESGPGYTRAV